MRSLNIYVTIHQAEKDAVSAAERAAERAAQQAERAAVPAAQTIFKLMDAILEWPCCSRWRHFRMSNLGTSFQNGDDKI